MFAQHCYYCLVLDEADSVGSLSESEEEIEKPPSVSDVSSSDYDSDDETGEDLSTFLTVQRT